MTSQFASAHIFFLFHPFNFNSFMLLPTMWMFICVFVCWVYLCSMTQKCRSKAICHHLPFSLAQGIFLLFFSIYKFSQPISLFPILSGTSLHRRGQIFRVDQRFDLKASDIHAANVLPDEPATSPKLNHFFIGVLSSSRQRASH